MSFNPQSVIPAEIPAAMPGAFPVVSLGRVGTTQPAMDCALISIGHGQIHLNSYRWVGETSPVIITFDRVAVQGWVEYCNRKDDHYLICVQIITTTHDRKEPRFPLNDPCIATVLNDKETQKLKGRLVDVSSSGLGLQLNGAVALEITIFVETEALLIVGTVRHCRQVSEGIYVAGLQTTDIVADARENHGLSRLDRVRRRVAGVVLGRPIVR